MLPNDLSPRRGLVFAAAITLALAADAGAAVTCSVARVELPDAFAGQQLLVSDNGRDVTRDTTYASTNPAVAKVDAKGYVTPAGDGSAVIRITRGNDKLEVPVTVKGFGGTGRGVDFRTEVMPLLSKHGCNAGGCHGKQSGQNGFKLSLFGFDTAFDYEAIAKEARGRRLFPANPDASLFLVKAAGKVPHGGDGLRPSFFHFATASSSILLFGLKSGMSASGGPCGTIARNTATKPMCRAMIAASPLSLPAFTPASASTAATTSRLLKYSDCRVTSRVLPSE